MSLMRHPHYLGLRVRSFIMSVLYVVERTECEFFFVKIFVSSQNITLSEENPFFSMPVVVRAFGAFFNNF